MSHPKAFKSKNPFEHMGQWMPSNVQKILDQEQSDKETFLEYRERMKEEMSLLNEVHMMQSEQTANELVDREIEIIEQMKRDRVVNIND